MTTPSDLNRLSAEAREGIGALRSRVIRRANGALPYDYIVPSGVYEEQWDWDAFFVGLHLISVDENVDTHQRCKKQWVSTFFPRFLLMLSPA